jgi:hypothetical protein
MHYRQKLNQTNFAKTGRKLAEIALQELGSKDENWFLLFLKNSLKKVDLRQTRLWTSSGNVEKTRTSGLLKS